MLQPALRPHRCYCWAACNKGFKRARLVPLHYSLRECRGLQPLLGSAADVGRFVLIRVDAYPNLKQSTRNGAEHLGWSMKIVKFDKKRLWIQEKGQSATGFTVEQARSLVLLSV